MKIKTIIEEYWLSVVIFSVWATVCSIVALSV